MRGGTVVWKSERYDIGGHTLPTFYYFPVVGLPEVHCDTSEIRSGQSNHFWNRKSGTANICGKKWDHGLYRSYCFYSDLVWFSGSSAELK